MSKAYLLDTETNIGPKEGEPEVIELAYLPLPDNVIDVNEDEFSKTTFIFDRFYQPKTPISHSAMAVHRITPRRLGELATDKSSQAKDHLPPDMTYMVGHNITFDYNVLGKPANVKLVDTLILAKYVWPGLSSYSQNALMLSIEGFQPDPDYESVLKMQANAHSAKFDIINLTYILQPMCAILGKEFPTWEDLYNLCESLRIPTVIEFGKHAGTPFADLPPDYLKWMLKQDFDQYVMTAVKRALGRHLT